MSECCHHDCCSKEQPASSAVQIPEGAAARTFRVRGMDCPDEIAAIEREMKTVPRVVGVTANLMASSVTIHTDGAVPDEELVRAINRSGVTVESGEGEKRRRISLPTWLVALSGFGTGLGIALQWAGWRETLWPDMAFLIAIVSGGALVLPKALRAVRSRSLDMNVLMTVAVIGAVSIGEHAEGAAVAFLFSLSELLESWSVGRARRAILALMELAPETALVKREGDFTEVSADSVKIGELVLVRSGQRIPLDGRVVGGSSAVNQAPITGESLPVEKSPGDTVFAGTINGDGSLQIETTKAAGDTTLARIIHMVEEAQATKAPAQRFVDNFARIYTPAVMVFAIALALVPPLVFGQPWMDWIYRALVLLVIACPCALVIATPVSVVSGLAALARAGVLVKGGAYLEALGGLKALALDKTGTITEGKPKVVDIQPVGEASVAEILRIAASINAHSTHPLAGAIVDRAQTDALDFDECSDYRSVQGRGAEGSLGGHEYFVGNHRFAHEIGVCSPGLEKRLAEIEAAARSVVVVGHRPHGDCTGEVLGVIAIADTIRPEARNAIARMHEAGLRHVVMLSGDNTKTARAIAKEAGIDEAYGDLLPDDKIAKVKELAAKYGSVGMIGDGVNDAPALAVANVGIAMGAAGTDAAIETADVALMRDDLGMVPEAIRLGRRTLGMIRFNIAFALAIKAVFLLLAVFGLTSLWFAILADTGATLLVTANALRLLRGVKA
ncbi:MAG: cadmium-translocating P-type ATPase [Verrucomicrobia bacterium]|nr:cadmium-translocating P-type ATPase [Verrucomicrobiota bacterium]